MNEDGNTTYFENKDEILEFSIKKELISETSKTAKRNTSIFKKLIKLKLRREKISKELDVILNSLTDEELNAPVHASNSSTLEELILCFVNYGEDENVLYSHLFK